MVFESVVTDVLNRVLGDYVENLDSKQLKIGIWGGDVVLKNLVLKSSALDDLDLPVQLVYGQLGKLVLKIPWKNLYGEAVVASIEDLFVLVTPNQQNVYNAEKETEKESKTKQGELQRIEEAKKKEAEKGKPKPDDTFVEKLTTQVIKNVQLKISNIHIRYEDKVTQPSCPFALGVTLSNLSLETTDETWKPTIVQEMVTKIYKVVNLEGLAVYWNSNSEMYSNLPPVDFLNHFNQEIATKTSRPENYRYILGPINSSARLRLNPKPDCDAPAFSIPKVHLNLEMEKLSIGITKKQYQNIIALVESMDRMLKGVPYRQFRPALQIYKGHYKQWWHFAYECVLQDVKRIKRNWDWNHILEHRNMCRSYASAYQIKLTQKKVSANVQAQLNDFEKKLDIFNIILIRQRIELECERLGKLQESVQKKSWFSSWWGGNTQEDKEHAQSVDILQKFEDAMTPEEKSRLYQAIGYQENSAPLEYPQAFIDKTCTFVLRSLEITVQGDLHLSSPVIRSELKGVKCRLDTRAAASAMKVAVNIDELYINGFQQKEFIPQLVTSKTQLDEGGALLDILFETNPLDKTCDQRVHVNAKPLKIIYDALTVNEIINVFRTPPSSTLDELSAAAGSRLNNFKEMSAIGLQHAVEKHSILDLNVNLHAPFVVIPHGGKYTGSENVLVINLGRLQVLSVPRMQAKVSTLHAQGAEVTTIMKEMILQSYDKFTLEFTDLQIVLAQSGEDWISFITESKVTASHLLNPMSLNLTFYKCLVSDDPRLPLSKVRAELPSINFNITDTRLLLLVSLATSIPLPEETPPEPVPLMRSSRSHTSSLSSLLHLDVVQKIPRKSIEKRQEEDYKDGFMQFTTMDAKFIMKEFSLILRHQSQSSSYGQELINFKVNSLECDLVQQNYNTEVNVRLGGVACQQNFNDDYINIIDTPLKSEEDEYLFHVKFLQVDKKSPEFHSKYKSCESLLDLQFKSLHVILHQEGLQHLIKFATDIQKEIDDILNTSKRVREAMNAISTTRVRRLSSIAENVTSIKNLKQGRKSKLAGKSLLVETIQFKVVANLQQVAVTFACAAHNISTCAIEGLRTSVIMKKSYTQVIANLSSIMVTDLNKKTIHPKILSVKSQEEAINVEVVMYSSDHKACDPNSVDMSIEATMGCLRIVFLNRFVLDILDFINQFQTAVQAISEASQAAAETAKQNMQSAYENAVRVSLKVNLKAPDIIVPVSSTECHALLLDLGQITISNRFLQLDFTSSQRQNAVLDEMSLKLTNFTLLRIKLDAQGNTISKCSILEPVTFALSVKRNLSASWCHKIPNIELYGKINAIVILLSQADYQMIMRILKGNLAEGSAPTSPEVISSRSNQEIKAIEDTKLQEIDVMTYPLMEESEVDQNEIYTSIKFSLTLESLIINLYTGGSKMLSENSPKRHPKNSLARFSLEVLSVKGSIMSDSTIATSVLLLNCLMDDTRENRGSKLNRLIERKSEETTSLDTKIPPRSMIDVVFKQTKNDMFVDVKVWSFIIILSVEYLMKIAEFFAAEDDEDLTKVAKQNTITASNKPSSTAIKSSATKPDTESTMTINIQLEKPDIILVDNMNSIDTNALILNAEILMKVRMAGQHQVINGQINNIQLYTCCYDPAKRAETKSSVLHPVSISVAGSTPEGQGLHIEVCITDIRIRVSPTTIELLNAVYSNMISMDKAKKDSEAELNDYHHIWENRTFEDQEFWFLKAEVAEEALSSIRSNFSSSSLQPKKEMCIVSMPSLIITVEAGVGSKTLPMLLLESNFRGSVCDWSSQLAVEATSSLQIGYYNSTLAMWEPLIEPIEVINENKSVYLPWELKLEVTCNETEDDQTPLSPSSDSEDQFVQIQQAKMIIDISSKTNLELTVTKTCLDVLNNLSQAFSQAMASTEITPVTASSPYKVKNDSGIKVTLCLNKGAFKVSGKQSLLDVVLETGAEVPLELKSSSEVSSPLKLTKELKQTSQKEIERFLNIEVHDFKCKLELPVVRADKRYFSLNHRSENNDTWGLVSDVTVENGVIIITLRSILQVYNHFNIPLDIYYMTFRGNELECIATIDPGTSFNVPLKAVYTPTSEMFFSVPGYAVTSTPFIWKDLQLNLSVTKQMLCPLNKTTGDNNSEPFVIKSIGETEQIYFENTTRHTMTSTNYNIHLHPAVSLKNCLPYNIICCVQNIPSEQLVKPGEMLQMPNVTPGSSKIVIRLPEYLEKEWSCQHEVDSNPPDFSVWQFDSFDSSIKISLELGMHVLIKNGYMVMSLYCPFWMLNKTELLLSYRKSKKTEKNESFGSPTKNGDDNLNILHHPASFKGPVLFSFNAKNFFGKKKASIRVEQGEWSDKFSLDVAGSSGFVVCKSNNMLYQIGVHNQLTYNNLTKQITFTPYYVVINNAPFAIECQEYDRPADKWLKIEGNSCSALWPRSEQEDKLLRLRVCGTKEVSASFMYTETHTVLLKLLNTYGGINVDIQITEGAVYINLFTYEAGMAPALIINHTKNTLSLWEKETVQIRKLQPDNCVYYTWENPSGSRVLAWDIGHKKELEDDLRKDGIGEFSPTDNCCIYWVSFLDGMQRILLFTTDKEIAENVQSAKQFEGSDKELNVSIHGLGLSLVNNVQRHEIMYIGVASSGIIWETCKVNSKRYKQLNAKDSESMESSYQNYLNKQYVAGTHNETTYVDNKTEVDFQNNMMLKPHKRKIRRTFQTGLWLQMKTSPSQLQLHAKINRLQIDNQMLDCVFPVVLAPVPPPKSVAQDNVQKPFAELSIVQRIIKYSSICQYKYFKVLIQEFHIKVDLGFVNAIIELFKGSEQSDEEEKKLFLEDCKLVDQPLLAHVSTQSSQEQKNFYDLLHFSPLKVHISFSLATGSSIQGTDTPNFLNVLLQGLGVTLTDMQDVVFRLAYFQREYTFLTKRQLINEAQTHYVGQSIKQLYVLVLGLDVLGNPYGLVLGITKGVEDFFYEPFQGAIQGPGEFAEGLVLGVRSLFGHTVGGAAGAVSRITGAMGKGIAVLTFDKDFQRKRRDQFNKKPATVQEGIARGGKGLVMGVVDGVTGVFTKPISGAKEQGVEGFFKGLGKGAVGLVTRPTAGVIDFASGSLDAVKRATELGEEANRLRPPRLLQSDGFVKPYNRKEAVGNKLLHDLEKGKYANTDTYRKHFVIIEKKEVLLLTDQRLAYITHNDIFGGWQIDWSYTWVEIPNSPKVVPKGISITIGETKKKSFFGSNDVGKIILVGDPALKEEICRSIEELTQSFA